MKKAGIGIICALALLYALTTWLMGYSIEQYLDAALDQLHQRTPYLTVDSRQYRRGWSTSEEDLTLQLFRDGVAAIPGAATPAGALFAPLRLTVHSVIHHGPLCGLWCIGRARIDSRVVLEGDAGKALSALFAPADALVGHSRIGFFGTAYTVLSSPAVAEKVLADGTRIVWGGLEITINSGANAASSVHGTAPHLLYAGADGKRVEVTAVALDTRSQRALRSLYAGDSSLTVGRIALTGARGANIISVEDFRSTVDSAVSGGFMSVQMQTGSGAITTAPAALAGLHFDFTLRHLELQAVESLTAALRDANQNPTLPAAARSEAMQQAFSRPGIELLAHDPEMAVDRVSIAAANGTALLNGTVRLPGTVPADFAGGAATHALLQKLEANLDLTIEDAFLNSLPGIAASVQPRLQPLVDQGLFTHDNGKFHTKIVIHDGQATFDGQPLHAGGMVPPPGTASPGTPPRPPPGLRK